MCYELLPELVPISLASSEVIFIATHSVFTIDAVSNENNIFKIVYPYLLTISPAPTSTISAKVLDFSSDSVPFVSRQPFLLVCPVVITKNKRNRL